MSLLKLFSLIALVVCVGRASLVADRTRGIASHTEESKSVVSSGNVRMAEPSYADEGLANLKRFDEKKIVSPEKAFLAVVHDKSMSNEQKFTFFWDNYQENKSSQWLATYYIDGLSSIVPLPHIEKLLNELGDPMLGAEIKNHLMRALQYGYLEENGLSENDKRLVLSAIKSNISNNDPTIAGEAVSLYARMGTDDNVGAILEEALQRKVIAPVSFVQEGAFQLSNAESPQQQSALVHKLIRVAEVDGSGEVVQMLTGCLALVIQSPTRMARLDETSKDLLVQYFATHEPPIHYDGIDLSLVDSIYYSDWLASYAKLINRSDATAIEWVAQQLGTPAAESKKVVAVLTSPMGPDLVKRFREGGQLDGLKNKIGRDFAGQRPATSAYQAYESALAILN